MTGHGFSSVSGDESIMFADNVSFNGTDRGGKITTNGEILIGSTAAPHIRKGLPSNGNNITWTAGAGTLQPNLTGTTNHALQLGNATGSLTSLGVANNGAIPIGSTGADPVVAVPTNGSNISWVTGAGSLKANVSGTTNHTIQLGNAGGSLTSATTLTNGQVLIGSTGADPVAATPTNGNNISWTTGVGALTANLTGTTNHTIQLGNAGGSLTSSSALTNGQLLIGNTGNDPTAATLASANSSITITNGAGSIDLKGKLIQTVTSTTATFTNAVAQIPFDDTIPQNTEGREILTATITPTSSTSKLKIEFYCPLCCVDSDENLTIALFQDTTADALTASYIYINNTSISLSSSGYLNYIMTSGTTSSTTFKIRMGASTVTGVSVNGEAAHRNYGGVAVTSLTITEYNS